VTFKQCAVTLCLLGNSCGIPNSFAEDLDLYKQFCDQISGTTELDIINTKAHIRAAGVTYMVDVDVPEACFIFEGIHATVKPDRLCIDLADDKDKPNITVTFPNGDKQDVSDAYQPEALRPWANNLYSKCVEDIGPPV
jgi:hypothetical protein